MNTKNYTTSNSFFKLLFVLMIFLGGTITAQEDETETEEEETQSEVTTVSMGSMELPTPPSIKDLYVYDPITDRYIYTKTLGSFNITYPIILTPEEYQDLILKEEMRNYFKDKIKAADGKTEGSEELQKNLLPSFYVESSFFESIFGGNVIEVIPQGSVEMDLGFLFTKQDNPAFSPRNRSNLSFDFDQRISLSLLGKVGERLQVTANFDTQSTFDFQNQIKLEFTPTEDDIIQKIEVGNVSMPLNSTLIQGAQSLFGVKTQLQFGKTTITGVFSEQNSDTRSVVAEGGATVTDYEFFASEYDENRHYFLAHFFRDNYNRTLDQYPFINSNVQITRAEVWVTNRTNRTDDVRSIVAIQDIGESDISNIGLDIPPGGFLNKPRTAFPDNGNNDFNPFGIEGNEMSILNESIRDIATVDSGFGLNVSDGTDFATLESARRLQPNEYKLDTQLGYLSLNQRLNNDEVLGVAFQYTVNGQVFQVGEFSTDGVDASGGQVIGNNDPDNPDDLPEAAIQQSLVVKMLKSNITNVNEPVWDLMMKNIYSLGALQLEQEDFILNVLYTNPSPVNFITTADPLEPLPDDVENTTLLRVFNLDRLNINNDPVQGGDGFFDFFPGITVDQQNGRIIFTTVEPFGEFLFNKLDDGTGSAQFDIPSTYNANQDQYVYRSLYRTTKIQAQQEDSDKDLFQIKGRYKSTGSDGIAIGAFNIPQGSVTVTAGGRTLVEGVDYTVNYQLGRVQIIDPALQASNTPINISVENNTLFGQQTKRFTGLNVEHKFNENFLIGGTYLNLNERPLTQKSNFNSEPINNTVYGLNAAYSTEVPFLTRLVNRLPNIDTDVESNVSVRGEFAYLSPGAPNVSDFDGRTTAYVDDFEASQTGVDVSAPLSWFLSSAPIGFGGEIATGLLETNFRRAKINWYTIDPVFYSSGRPDGISDEDLSSPFTRRVFRDEIFPNQDIVQGQTQALFTLDLNYFPSERGEYNYNPAASPDANGDLNVLPNPTNNFGGIMRQLTTTDFERTNVEFIEFWVMNPFIYDENATNPGGTLRFNLGNVSEDVLKDGRKQYENGLPTEAGSTAGTIEVPYGKVPANQALIYTFDSTGDARTAQDIGYDGFNDDEEMANFGEFGQDPARDNYQFFLQTEGSIRDRYRSFNGTEGNSPETVTSTNRGSTAQPDVEDVNRDRTTNTVESYFEYEVPFTPETMSAVTNEFITDFREIEVTTPDGDDLTTQWVQFRVPVSEGTSINGISDFRSIRFMRMFLADFEQPTTLRFGTLELVRGDYRRFLETLDFATGEDPNLDDTVFEVEAVNIEANDNRIPIPYRLPPGVIREQINNNNSIIRQNEQSLAMRTIGLEPNDGRAAFKNFNIDMRQYKNLEMFLHAESLEEEVPLADGEMVAFVRLGNDLSQNFYEIQIPLNPTQFNTEDPEEIWPEANRLDLRLSLLQRLKSMVLDAATPLPPGSTEEDGIVFINESELSEDGAAGENELRIGIKGNPSFGNVRVIMLGLRNSSDQDISGEVWFNELRLSELENQGGWAAVASLDANLADFANVSATANKQTIGFGSVDQNPNERSREDAEGYDFVTNLNLGQILPEKWGVQLPFNYGRSVQRITPQFDPEFQDIELDTRLDNTEDPEERDRILQQSIDFTKRQSVNLIGVRKERTGDAAPKIYDIENVTLSGSYNQLDHNDFQIEEAFEQVVQAGGTYNYNFTAKPLEPFKKNDSLFTSKYLKFLKDVNINYLPSSINFGSNITRKFNRQKFRVVNPAEGSLPTPTLFQRNYLFDWNYGVNWNLTNSLRFNFTSANNRIVTNFIDDEGIVNNEVGVWDEFFDVGDPNLHQQQLELNYDLPFDKIPFLNFIRSTYSYTGTFQWQDGSDLFNSIDITLQDGTTDNFNLGNSVQNSSAHRINSNLDFTRLYRDIGLTKKRATTARNNRNSRDGKNETLSKDGNSLSSAREDRGADQNGGEGGLTSGDKAKNTLIGFVTMIKKIQLNYTQNEGTFLPGYTPSVGFLGTVRPTTGFTFGSQRDVRELAARRGWLTLYPEFNEQYTETDTRQLDIQANLEPFEDLKIDLNASRTLSENYFENYIVRDGLYNSLTPTTFGNFNISTFLLKTSFGRSNENESAAFSEFRENRLAVANRLATDFFGTTDFETDEDGFPVGFGKTSQDVLLPAFLSAYKGSDVDNEETGFLRGVPLPNWDLKYTGLMKIDWFKKNFKRFSVQHGYRASYTVNQFQTNLDFNRADPTETDQAGNIKSEVFLTNVNLTEQFSPLIRVDFEMKNSVKILAEVRKDRALGLSFANSLLTEINGTEYTLGLGYRIKDLRIPTNFGGKKTILKSDLNFKLDGSRRNNITIIRNLDLNNNLITAGQTIYGLQFTADYSISKNLTVLFYYDHTFSETAISTAFPQTTIRSGFTLRYNFGN